MILLDVKFVLQIEYQFLILQWNVSVLQDRLLTPIQIFVQVNDMKNYYSLIYIFYKLACDVAVFENKFSDDYLFINISLAINFKIIDFDENID